MIQFCLRVNKKTSANSGTISHTQALEKAKQEYRKYQEKTIAPVEQAYLDTIHDLEKEAKNKSEIENSLH